MHGYTSSEESEDPKRPRPPPATSANNDNKKKHKRRVPPQPSINHTWKKFSKRNFDKALSVLPFDPVQPPATLKQTNEPLNDGYLRAAEECKRKVEKIVKECKRVNMRYRDPGFDLDWDLKSEKGYTLNSLDETKFELNSRTLLASSASVPKASKRVHEIFNEPTFMEKINSGDVKQGSVGDCWIMGAMSALSNVPDGIERLCVAHNSKIGIYGFVFYRDGEWIYSIIDDKLFLTSPCWDSPSLQRDLLQQIDREDQDRVYRETYQTGSKALFFAQNVNQNETWVPLMEKAFAKAHGDYAALGGGWTGEGLEDLSGGVTNEMLTADILDTDEFWVNEMSKINQEFLFGCSTGILEYGNGPRDGIQTAHAYVITDARTLKSGERLLKLRNPWGQVRKGVWEGAWSDGSKDWTREAQDELDHKFGSDSVFWISYKDFLRKFTHLDRTRLFREKNWHCAQRWIGVDVPWKPHFHEKFQIKISQDSPLVIVLSQLNWRYFKGLQGQYRFRLHFRLHDEGRPDAADYIVRSHGNFFTRRSVSVELPDMAPGTYTVYVMVKAERDTAVSSVEQVVKDQLKKRVENEKLAQVGHAYDLAHSKAWDHLDKVAKLRKKAEFAKASASRQKERRRNWEKRHINRTVTKEQTKKNTDKKDKKREEFELRQKKLEEEEEEAERKEKAKRDAEEAKTAKEGGKKKKEAKAGQGEAEEEKALKAEDEGSEADTEDAAEGDDEKDVAAKEGTETDAKSTESPPEDKDDANSCASTTTSNGTPILTPKSDSSNIVPSTDKEPVPPVKDGPPPPATSETPAEAEAEPSKPKPKYDSAAESSDSPVSDYELMYSSDDMVRKPRVTAIQPPLRDGNETEEEKLPDPWNAICIVGIRVYSKDPGLQLRTVMEGSNMLEGGMGEKGQSDLDDAQANAGGIRADEQGNSKDSKLDNVKRDDDADDSVEKHDSSKPSPASGDDYPAVVQHQDDKLVEVDSMGKKLSDIYKYIKIDSGDSTPCNTPRLGDSKQLEAQDD